MPSPLRRRRTPACGAERGSARRAGRPTPQKRGTRGRESSTILLWHHDDVAGTDEEVVVRSLSGLPVVKGAARGRSTALSEHDDAIARGELGDALGLREELE